MTCASVSSSSCALTTWPEAPQTTAVAATAPRKDLPAPLTSARRGGQLPDRVVRQP